MEGLSFTSFICLIVGVFFFFWVGYLVKKFGFFDGLDILFCIFGILLLIASTISIEEDGKKQSLGYYAPISFLRVGETYETVSCVKINFTNKPYYSAIVANRLRDEALYYNFGDSCPPSSFVKLQNGNIQSVDLKIEVK